MQVIGATTLHEKLCVVQSIIVGRVHDLPVLAAPAGM